MPSNYEIEFDEKNRRVKAKLGTTYHTIMMDDIYAFIDQINTTLSEVPEVSSYLPIDASNLQNLDLFDKISDGKILAALLNVIEPDTIDLRVMNIEKKSAALKEGLKRDNIALLLSSLSSVGIQKGAVHLISFLEWRNSLNLLMGLLWQILKKIVLKEIDLHHNNNLARLLRDGETLEDLLKLSSEELLLRWLNYQLTDSGSSIRAANLSESLSDCRAYMVLFDHIDKTTFQASYPEIMAKGSKADSKQLKEAAEAIVAHGRSKYDFHAHISSHFILSGLERVNTMFLATVFNRNPSLEAVEKIELEDDSELDGEMKAIRNWMNSMLVNEEVEDVYEAGAIATQPLKIIERIKASTVHWAKVKKVPGNLFQRIANCEELIAASKKALGLRLTGLHAKSIAEKDKKKVNGFFLLVMVYQGLEVLRNTVIGGKKIEPEDVQKWVADRISSVDKEVRVEYGSEDWKSGVAPICLLASISPDVINWEYVTKENPEEKDKRRNIGYALTVARKLGAVLFYGPDAFLGGNKKMIQLFCIEVMKIGQKGN